MRAPPRRVARTGAALAVLLALSGSGAALGKTEDVRRYITSAAHLYENLEYERALEQLSRAKRLASRPEDDVAIALYEGIILGDLGRWEDSRAAFKAGLFLSPDAKLPVKVSPKLEAELEKVRTEVKRELQRGAARDDAREQLEVKPPPADTPVRDHGKLVAVPPEKAGPELAASPAPEERGSRVLPFVLLGAGALAGGAGGYFGLQSRSELNAARAAEWMEETEAHRQRAAGNALIANVLFATAGAAAVGALIGFAVGGDSAPEAAKR